MVPVPMMERYAYEYAQAYVPVIRPSCTSISIATRGSRLNASTFRPTPAECTHSAKRGASASISSGSAQS